MKSKKDKAVVMGVRRKHTGKKGAKKYGRDKILNVLNIEQKENVKKVRHVELPSKKDLRKKRNLKRN